MGEKNFRDITSLKVGGSIKHFFEVKNKEGLVRAVIFAKSNKLPIFTIGDGTDIAVSDDDYNGVVIKYIGNNISYTGNNVTAESGVNWDKLVEETVNRNLQGIECLSGIPGTVGAAPIQNIGAYGQELSDIFHNLTAYNIGKEKFVTFDKNDCKFGYRSSKFKNIKFWQKFIITDVILKLNKNKKLDLNKIRQDILKLRNEKLEDPKLIPNAGSFFINPFVNFKTKERLEKKYRDMKFYVTGDKFKIPAGYLIEKAGWKGKSLGPVKVSDKHALVIINPDGKGTFKDIKKLADAIIKDVNKIFGIKLEPEVQYINV
ncbi:MAG: UDP-N-acetylmuramate dehydrogenase [Candidatus Woesebacteria bacterium]|nr:UDP-N-acetylmuramate dehydrogenase [Candidatus Woesebacteria bacterium]